MGIRKKVLGSTRKSMRPIFATHLAYAALGVVLFVPLMDILGRLLLRFSGQPALADQDIAWFLLTPFGMAALILFAALLIGVLAFEQASLMMIGAGAAQGLRAGNRSQANARAECGIRCLGPGRGTSLCRYRRPDVPGRTHWRHAMYRPALALGMWLAGVRLKRSRCHRRIR